MNATELIIQRLKLYSGSLLSSRWKVPKSKRQFSHALNRVIKLFYAMQNRNLYYPQLVNAIKQVAIYFKLYIIKHRPDKMLYYLTELDTIINFEPPYVFDRIEKVRVKENKRCSVCRCNLTYPAYLIYRTNEGIEIQSEATGIFCLEQLHGYIQNFKDSIEVEWAINSIKEGITESGKEMLKVG